MIDIYTYIVMIIILNSVNNFKQICMSTAIVYKLLAAQLKSTAELKSVKSPTLPIIIKSFNGSSINQWSLRWSRNTNYAPRIKFIIKEHV